MLHSEKPTPRVQKKPLPQVLNEMDANIKAAIEAAIRAEEAAKRVDEATKAAIKASTEAERRADEARKAGEIAAQEATAAANKAVAEFKEIARATIASYKKAIAEVEKQKITNTDTKKYLVILEKAESNYSAYSPDIPGCIATGKTRDEVEKNIKKAISFHIEGIKEDGLPLPEPASSIEYVEV